MSYIYPLTELRCSSRYYRDIRVVFEAGQRKLLINGARQSGRDILSLWRQVLSGFGLTKLRSVRRILVLGVGGGSVIHLLQASYQKAHIVGVDIDSKILKLGRKFFGLDSPINLTLINADANMFVGDASEARRRYDLVIVDLFSGSEIPDFVGGETFLKHIRTLLTHMGNVVVNYSLAESDTARNGALQRKLRRLIGESREVTIGHYVMQTARKVK